MSDKTDELRPEYPAELISAGVRGKYVSQYQEETNLVLIEPDLHEYFPDSDSVNRALREHLEERRRADLTRP